MEKNLKPYKNLGKKYVKKKREPIERNSYLSGLKKEDDYNEYWKRGQSWCKKTY